MKTLFPFLIFFLFLFCGCKTSNDQVIAEVLNKKLYSSEIVAQLPAGLSPADSIKMLNHLVDDWVKKQLILFEADKYLAVREKNFEKELENYKKDLLIHAFFQKLADDSLQFSYTDEELRDFVRQYEGEPVGDKVIVKLNYVKLSPKSKALKPLKAILFDEKKRVFEKERIEEICADTIEYFIDDYTWLYLDDIRRYLPIDLDENEEIANEKRYIEKHWGNYFYLIVLLDKGTNPYDFGKSGDYDAAKAMIIQQKKTEYINRYIDTLYKRATENNLIIR